MDPHQTLDEVLGGAQHVAAAVTDAIASLQRHDAAVLQAANQNVTNDPASDVGDEASAEASTFPPLSTSTTTAAAAVMKMPSATEVAQARELLAATMGPRLREAFFRSDSSSSFSSSAAVANESEADKKEEKEATSSLLLTPQAAACMPLCPQGLAPEAFGVSVTSVRCENQRGLLYLFLIEKLNFIAFHSQSQFSVLIPKITLPRSSFDVCIF